MKISYVKFKVCRKQECYTIRITCLSDLQKTIMQAVCTGARQRVYLLDPQPLVSLPGGIFPTFLLFFLVNCSFRNSLGVIFMFPCSPANSVRSGRIQVMSVQQIPFSWQLSFQLLCGTSSSIKLRGHLIVCSIPTDSFGNMGHMPLERKRFCKI